MNFEEKIRLAVEMADARINFSTNENGEIVEMKKEKLSLVANDNNDKNLYADLVRAMFTFIDTLEAEQRSASTPMAMPPISEISIKENDS